MGGEGQGASASERRQKGGRWICREAKERSGPRFLLRLVAAGVLSRTLSREVGDVLSGSSVAHPAPPEPLLGRSSVAATVPGPGSPSQQCSHTGLLPVQSFLCVIPGFPLLSDCFSFLCWLLSLCLKVFLVLWPIWVLLSLCIVALLISAALSSRNNCILVA